MTEVWQYTISHSRIFMRVRILLLIFQFFSSFNQRQKSSHYVERRCGEYERSNRYLTTRHTSLQIEREIINATESSFSSVRLIFQPLYLLIWTLTHCVLMFNVYP